MDRYHVTKEVVHRELEAIDMVPGMEKVLEHLHGIGSELIVLSGANDHLCW